MAEVDSDRAQRIDELYPEAGVTFEAFTPDVLLQGDERLELAGIEFETLNVPATSRATSPSTRTARSSRATSSSPARSAATDRPDGDWETLLDSIRRSLERFPPETVVYSGHGPPTTLGDELARNPFLAELRAVKFEAPRGTHDILPSEQPRWRQVLGGVRAPVPPVRLPPDRHARLRGHRALRAHVRAGL